MKCRCGADLTPSHRRPDTKICTHCDRPCRSNAGARGCRYCRKLGTHLPEAPK